MTAESELLHVAEDQIVHNLEEAQHDQLVRDLQRIGHGASIANAPSRPNEATPLVLKAGKHAVVGLHDDEVDLAGLRGTLELQSQEDARADQYMSTSEIVREETKGVFRLAVPFAGTQVVEVLPDVLFSVLLGNVAGSQAASIIAASALNDFFQGQVALNLSSGLGSALETVCAQSFGAKQYRQLCLYAQAGVLAAAYIIPAIALVSLNGATIFKLLGQDPGLAELAGVFTAVNVLSMPFTNLFFIAKSVLVSQHIVTPFVVIPITANALALPIAYLLGFYTSLGYVGVLLGLVIASVLKFVMAVPLLFQSPAFAHAAWPGFQWREAHALMWRLLPLGVSSILMVTFQALGLGIVGFLCGYLPDVAQTMAANNIASALFSLALVPMTAVFASCCIRVGTALGTGKANRAAIAGGVGAAMTIGVALVSALASLLIADSFSHSYTQDEATAAAATSLYYNLLPTIPLFGWMLGVQGVLRACGRQWLIANLSFVFLFVIGVPVALFLAITCELGVQGLWYGQMLGMLGCSAVSTVIVWRLDWDAVAHEAYLNTHVHVDEEPVGEPPVVASDVA